MIESCHVCGEQPVEYVIKVTLLADGRIKDTIKVCRTCLRETYGFTNIKS